MDLMCACVQGAEVVRMYETLLGKEGFRKASSTSHCSEAVRQ